VPTRSLLPAANPAARSPTVAWTKRRKGKAQRLTFRYHVGSLWKTPGIEAERRRLVRSARTGRFSRWTPR
jgi:hypothetical protein